MVPGAKPAFPKWLLGATLYAPNFGAKMQGISLNATTIITDSFVQRIGLVTLAWASHLNHSSMIPLLMYLCLLR